MEFDEKALTKLLKTDARALGIPVGSANVFIEQTIKSVKQSLKTKPHPTKSELNRLIIRELKKYSANLAYVYENRDKIV